jgi:hypothetical protein
VKVRDDDRCDRCDHERWAHLDFHRKPRSCAAEDAGEQCVGFVEPQPRYTLAEIEAAFDDTEDFRVFDFFRAALEGVKT